MNNCKRIFYCGEQNDLPDHQDDVLCDIVLNAFIDAELADQFT